METNIRKLRARMNVQNRRAEGRRKRKSQETK